MEFAEHDARRVVSAEFATHVCPACGGEDVERVHRRGPLERLVTTLLHRRAYRCLHCAHRFYDGRRLAA
jgi:predicted RNA-binding Zn-ribbon protein involved in translation (DUF1610 family)